MKKRVILIFIAVFVIILVVVLFLIIRQNYFRPQGVSNQTPAPKTQTQNSLSKQLKVAFPIADFEARITKKPFGIYITPQNSPVQPERFTGFHTGDDVEYGDVAADVPVYVVYDGQIVLSERVSGYGGTIVLKCNINNEDLYILYGHLSPASLILNNSEVKKGQQIAVLGKGYTEETDGERKHLHFSIHKGILDLHGYVQAFDELSGWYNPIDFYKNINGS